MVFSSFDKSGVLFSEIPANCKTWEKKRISFEIIGYLFLKYRPTAPVPENMSQKTPP